MREKKLQLDVQAVTQRLDEEENTIRGERYMVERA